jgi:hypothetical protein
MLIDSLEVLSEVMIEMNFRQRQEQRIGFVANKLDGGSGEDL